jgi:4-hydroxybenzoate polyprenyltransferase
MNALLAIPRFLRLPNLLIVFFSQAIPYWCVLRPAIARSGAMAVLTERTFGLLAGATVLVTLAGYVINDYFDRQIDAINKPRSVVVGRWLPPVAVLGLYWVLQGSIALIIIELYKNLPSQNGWVMLVFPVVSLLLYAYSWQAKCTPILGNLLVALLCGVTPLLVLLPESRPIALATYHAPEEMRTATTLVWLFGFFAFVTNLFREQIKDLEDVQGDSACGCHTLAVIRGVRFAKKNAGITGMVACGLIFLLLIFWQQTDATHAAQKVLLGVLLLLIPMAVGTFLVFRAAEKKHFSRASLFVKLAMLTGLLLLIPHWPDSAAAWEAEWGYWRALVGM